MNRTSLLSAAILLATCVGPADAAIVYSWQAPCLYRFTASPSEPVRDLGCPALVSGLIEMPDTYVPGTWFEGFGLPVAESPRFTMVSDFEHLKIHSAAMLEYVSIQLPVSSGLGEIFWNANSIGLRRLQFRIESPFPGGSGVDMGPMSFTRIPEPSSILLVALAIVTLTSSRHLRKRQSTASA